MQKDMQLLRFSFFVCQFKKKASVRQRGSVSRALWKRLHRPEAKCGEPNLSEGPRRWRSTPLHQRGRLEAAQGAPVSYLLSLVGGEGLLDVHQVQHLEDLGVVHVHPNRALQLILLGTGGGGDDQSSRGDDGGTPGRLTTP